MSRQTRGKRGGTLRLKQTRQTEPAPTRSVHGWTVIKIDTDAYLVQTPSGHDGVEVDLVAGTCTGSDRQCVLARSSGGNLVSGDGIGFDPQHEDGESSTNVNTNGISRGQHRQSPPGACSAGCVHVRAAAAAVKFGTALRRLDWRRSIARLREARAAAAASAAREDDDDEDDGDGGGWSQHNMFARDEPTPLEVKMRKWEQRRKQGYRFTARDPTDSGTEDDDDDDDGFSASTRPGVAAAGKRRTTPPFRGTTPPPPTGASHQSHDPGRGDGIRHDTAQQPGPAPASVDAEKSADGGDLFDAFVSKWNRFIKGDVAVTSLARVPFPTDVELVEMIPITLPSHRKRTRLRQLLLLLHPDKATSKLSERLPPTVKEPVWTRLKELSQKLTELGRGVG